MDTLEPMIEGLEDYDPFGLELSLFERDVHLLVLGTFGAAIAKLSEETDRNVAEIESLVKKYGGSSRLDDEYVETLSTHSDQTKFLRNNALVALVSRLQAAFLWMVRDARVFVTPPAPRNRTDRFKDKGEWGSILNNIEQRFGIDFPATITDFLWPMVAARNRIVHHGADPYERRPDGTPDLNSASAFLEYVSAQGEIDFGSAKLDLNAKAAVSLVRFAATEFRSLQVRNPSP
ncbi:MAG: hypothetical protein JWO13_513 [Acidobacteriales bacterium]|nr:hypothetical protein [Terriglobales bacterium]